jgi:hypothetical protein
MPAKSPFPASLLPRASTGPIVILVGAALLGADLVTRLLAVSNAPRPHRPCDMTGLFFLVALFLLAVGAPILAYVAHLFSARRPGRAALLLIAAVGVPMLLGLLLGPGGMVLGALFPVAMILVTSPVLLMCALGAQRDDLDGSDLLLAGGGAWLIAAELPTCVWAGVGLGVPAAGAFLGLGLVALAITRIVGRRRWAGSVARGEVAGLRVGGPVTDDLDLPRLSRGASYVVIERVEPLATAPYRIAPRREAEPIALIPAP